MLSAETALSSLLGSSVMAAFGRGGGALPAPAWTPALLTNPHLWLDASDTSTIIHTANAVSQWNNKFSGGFNAAQGTGSLQPSTNTRTVNGLNTLDFDLDSMTLPAGYYTVGDTSNAIFVVAQFDTTATAQRLVSGQVASGSRNALFWDATQVQGVSNTTYVPSAITETPSTANPQVFRMIRDGAEVRSAINTTLGPIVAGANVTINGAWVGSFGGTGFYFDGRMCEIVVMRAAPTAGELASLKAYFNAKWGTSA